MTALIDRFSWGLLLLIAVVIGTSILPARAQSGAVNGDWPYYGGDDESTRYSSIDQISRANVNGLEVRWTWKSDNYGGLREVASETTPLMVDGALYFTAGDRRGVVAADAGTGETLWIWLIDKDERYERARTERDVRNEFVATPVSDEDRSALRVWREVIKEDLGTRTAG